MKTHDHDNYACLPTFCRKTNIETSDSMTAERVFLLDSPKRGRKPNLTFFGLVDFMYAVNTALFTGKFDVWAFIKWETFARNPHLRRTDLGLIRVTGLYRPFSRSRSPQPSLFPLVPQQTGQHNKLPFSAWLLVHVLRKYATHVWMYVWSRQPGPWSIPADYDRSA